MLRAEDDDVAQVEVERTAGGYPWAQVPSTLRAFGNRPNGGPVVLGLDELPTSSKPCLRSHDGDHQLSEQEEQTFLANHGTPAFGQQRVLGTTARDLGADLTRRA